MNNLGIIYYTDNRIGAPIIPICQKQLLKAKLPISSCSLKPIDFGDNIVLENRKRSYPTMVLQIIMALEACKSKYVFFCEHDVLYPESHFDFTPPKDNIFYYNNNVWRWHIKTGFAITYDRMLPLSVLCVNREFVLNHYKLRQEKIKEWKLDELRYKEPRWARKWGYEPGTKKKRRGGFTDDDFDIWTSKDPVVDIRHKRTFSSPKITLESFIHKPTNWIQIPFEEVPYWNLGDLFPKYRNEQKINKDHQVV